MYVVDNQGNFMEMSRRQIEVERPQQSERYHLWIDSETVEVVIDTSQTLGVFWVGCDAQTHDIQSQRHCYC